MRARAPGRRTLHFEDYRAVEYRYVGPCTVAKNRDPTRFLGNFMTWAAETRKRLDGPQEPMLPIEALRLARDACTRHEPLTALHESVLKRIHTRLT